MKKFISVSLATVILISQTQIAFAGKGDEGFAGRKESQRVQQGSRKDSATRRARKREALWKKENSEDTAKSPVKPVTETPESSASKPFTVAQKLVLGMSLLSCAQGVSGSAPLSKNNTDLIGSTTGLMGTLLHRECVDHRISQDRKLLLNSVSGCLKETGMGGQPEGCVNNINPETSIDLKECEASFPESFKKDGHCYKRVSCNEPSGAKSSESSNLDGSNGEYDDEYSDSNSGSNSDANISPTRSSASGNSDNSKSNIVASSSGPRAGKSSSSTSFSSAKSSGKSPTNSESGKNTDQKSSVSPAQSSSQASSQTSSIGKKSNTNAGVDSSSTEHTSPKLTVAEIEEQMKQRERELEGLKKHREQAKNEEEKSRLQRVIDPLLTEIEKDKTALDGLRKKESEAENKVVESNGHVKREGDELNAARTNQDESRRQAIRARNERRMAEFELSEKERGIRCYQEKKSCVGNSKCKRSSECSADFKSQPPILENESIISVEETESKDKVSGKTPGRENTESKHAESTKSSRKPETASSQSCSGTGCYVNCSTAVVGGAALLAGGVALKTCLGTQKERELKRQRKRYEEQLAIYKDVEKDHEARYTALVKIVRDYDGFYGFNDLEKVYKDDSAFCGFVLEKRKDFLNNDKDWEQIKTSLRKYARE